MKRILGAAVRDPVFANLLMVFLVVAGIASLFSLRREMFPEFSFDTVTVTAVYPGATPEEIEEAVTIKVEEAVRGLDGVRKVESTSSEGVATVRIEVDAALRDPQDALVDVRNEVGRITTFPEEVDEPTIQLLTNRRDALTLVLHGDVLEESLTRVASDLEQQLLLLPEVSEVALSGIRPYEVTVAVREADLQRYGLTFDQVARAVAETSLDFPLGKMRSEREEQLLRIENRRQVGRELADVPVVTREDGTRVLLHEVARIDDAFDEDEQRVRLDGVPAVILKARHSSDEDTIRVAERVKAWMTATRSQLPAGLDLMVWDDASKNVSGRLDLLATNGAQGLFLVFVVLLFFLGVRLSFWVGLGLPVAFLTALLLLQAFGGSLNMISSFALIMILGILVDDSIVVAENIARHMRQEGYTMAAAIRGLQEVTWPVIASVTTTVVAFLPLFFIEGTMGKFIRIMPVAVIACLVASLIECLVILPAHLAHARAPRRGSGPSLRERIDARTDRFVERRYGPTIDWALRNRYVVLGLGAAFLVTSLGLVASGRAQFIFFPRLDSESIQATVSMPQGTPFERTLEVVGRIEAAARHLGEGLPLAEDGLPVTRGVLTRVGEGGAQSATVEVKLADSSARDVKSFTVLQRWQEEAGRAPEARSVTFGGTSHRPGGSPIELRLMASDLSASAAAAARLEEALAAYPGVFNVDDNLEPGKRELRFALRPQASALGVRTGDLARQLYAGFSGQEVHKLQRGRDEVEVRVRYESTLRERQEQLADLRLRLGPGHVVPLTWAADVERGRSLSRIERRDGRRVVTITADVDDGATNANQVVRDLRGGALAEVEARYPGLEVAFGGQQEEQGETLRSLLVGFFLALFGIYTILALLFGSYLQPLIVMMVIPIGFAGAIWGHVLWGLPLMIFSVFGMVGLTGIVVNDSLVLIDFVNRRRAAGASVLEAAARAGRVRFRAVFLTTITTVAGLLPILFERSLQAQFVIPMALSIAAGVAAATFLTLYVVPCAYVVLEDVRRLFVRRRPGPASPEPVAAAG